MPTISSTYPVGRRSPTPKATAPKPPSIAPTQDFYPSAGHFDSYKYSGGHLSTLTRTQMRNISELKAAQYENSNLSGYTNQTIAPGESTHSSASQSEHYNGGGHANQNTALRQQIHPLAAENLRPVSATPSSVDQSKFENAIPNGSNNGLDHFLFHQPQRSILDDDISVVNFTDPMMEPIKWEEHATEASSPDHPMPESVQPLSEVATRSFHNTMNQRASKPNLKGKRNPFAGRLPGPPPNPIKELPAMVDENQVADPLPEFVKELQDSFGEMMERIRRFRGQVEVQAEFGRVLLMGIHKKHITTKEGTDTPYATETLQSMLLEGFPSSPDFTNALTTAPGEIPVLVNLTNGDGEELWEKKVSEWLVKYQFCLVDRHSTEDARFTIEIDAETFVTRIKKSQRLGKIFVHVPGRHWDFLVTARGSGGGRGLEEEYNQLATAIELSLHVP
jgi:hypothetical protein